MTDKEKAIFERQADIQHAFLMGFMASNISFNGERFLYANVEVLGNPRYQMLLDRFIKGEK